MKKAKFKGVGRKAYLIGDKHTKKLKELFSYSVPGARYSPQFRAGVWDGKITMMRNGIVHIGLLRGMREVLEKEGWKIELSSWKDRPKIKLAKKGIVSDEEHSYQNKCVSAMLGAIKWGGGLILSATGTGKTAIASMFCSWTKCPVLFVVDTLDLLYQSKKEMEVWLKTKIGVVGKGEFSPERVTVATIQTLNAHIKDPKFLKWYKSVEVVIIDEVHVQMSRRNFQVMDRIQPKAVFGLTATLQLRKKPIRMRAYSICGPVVYEFPIKEATAQGVLSKGCAIQIRVNSDSVLKNTRPGWHYTAESAHKKNLDYKYEVVKNEPVNKAVIELVKEAMKRGFYVATLVERIIHLGILKKHFKKLKLNPQVCSGVVATDSRERRKTRFEKGESKLLLATRVFSKGINIKRLDLVIDAAQRSSKDDTLQKYGRAVRLHPKKKGIIYLDMVAATDRKPTRKGEKKPKTEKAASARFNALKKAGIPIVKIDYTDAKKTMNVAEKLLNKVLKGEVK